MQKTIESEIRSDRVVNHDEEVVVINEVPVEVVPAQVSDLVIVDGVDPNAVVKVDPVQRRSSMKSKYVPLASLLMIGILSNSGSTAAASTIKTSSGIAEQITIGQTTSAKRINRIQKISGISRTNIPQIIDASIQDSQIYGIAKIAK